MVNKYEGSLNASGKKFGIVVARFNNFITQNLLEGSLDALKRHGADEKDIAVAWVPGSYEIPLVAKKMISLKKFDAIICLGTLIRGDTPHFELISNEVTKGIAHLSMETNVPIIFGVITAENLEQAFERAGTKAGNKGFDAAVSAIEMVNLFENMK